MQSDVLESSLLYPRILTLKAVLLSCGSNVDFFLPSYMMNH